MKKNLFLRFVSVVVLFTFLYPPILPAVELQYKMAAYSRFTNYFTPGGKNAGLLTPQSMQAFVNAMSALNNVMLDPSKTEAEIKAVIAEQNSRLGSAGVTIDNNVYTKDIGTRKGVPYLVLMFKGQARSVYFLRDYSEWADDELEQLGITEKQDKDNLEVPGVAGLWITKEMPMIGGGKDILFGDVIVLDCLMAKKMLEYVRDPETGKIREVNQDPLDVLKSILQLGDSFQVVEDNKLQLVFMKESTQSVWQDRIRNAVTVIANNLEAVKTPNSVVREEGLILKVDADGIIYVMPSSGASDTVIANLEKQVQNAQRVQSDIARIEEPKDLRGFIDVDLRIFGVQNDAFQEILYRKLQELYNEGLSVVRVVGEPIELTGRMKAIMDKFNERAGTEEWRKISSTRSNTVTLVSSDNATLASERQATSTVIRLGFDGTVNMPQIFPAITIARAIIAVGGEENVTGGLFNDVKALYLSMVGEELRDEVSRVTSIAQLLAIILPPITAEDLRIYEYLLLGRKIAEVAA